MYADDTNFSIRSESMQKNIDIANSLLNRVNDWMNINKLRINTKKQ